MSVDRSSTLAGAVEAYAAGLAPAVGDVVRRAASAVPAFAERVHAAGLSADELASGDLARLPILTKDDVLARQQAEPPFGGMLAEGAAVRRVFQSPGPIYEPEIDGPDPWRWAPALTAAGIGRGDVVLNCFGYHLSPAGAMFEEGCRAVGATVIPGGIGNQDLQVQAVADLGVTAYVGLPSYLKALVERFDELGHGPERWRLSKALVTAEPLPDSLRALLQERVPTVLMSYGTAEVGLIAYETSPGSGLLPAPGVLVEVCELDSGTPVSQGEGQVVVTLARPEYPLIRFGTGDLSAWRTGQDGTARLAGVLGRVGEAVKVKGMFLHPRQAATVMNGLRGVAAWRFVIDRVNHKDELACEVVLDASAGDRDGVVEQVRSAVRSGLRFAAVVRAVDAVPEAESGRIIDARSWD
ncbi:phenylacetate--CoA ligase family protein [Intrasporangium sp.]|uniref:phenylacetate--CoA ligase family protein n=1 Tax=Intrasporangium sp. TaxID=1925024 RepID=UPI00293B645C|nr:phenylacetate--CoA ligase family protein [Intrasporangium sp.]MDV3221614.1 phenylacetate--CoA ligase family protein [Intrasporangium sp.]